MFELDLTVIRGDSFDQTILIEDETTGMPKDLSAWTWAAQARHDPDDVEIMATFMVDQTLAAQGELALRLLPSDTATMRGGFWDLQGSQGPNVVTTKGGGRVIVKRDVTR